MAAVAGLKPTQLQRVRGRLEAFAAEMFDSMPRKDQREWGEVYLRGLMMDGKRKSIEPMAARLEDGDEQCLQQFVNQSPWDPVPVRRALARRMGRELTPQAWVIDDTGFPKFGKMSVGVARQYSGALGKVGNCQIGGSVNACSDEASCPLDWRLFIPEEWDEDSEFNRERREKAKLPEDVHHVEKWRLALEMIDELCSWGLKPPVVLGDGAYGDITEFRSGLVERELEYVLDVKGATSAYSEEVQPERPEWKGAGRPPKSRYRKEPSSLKELALAAGEQAAETVTWREGTRGRMTSRFLALRIRPANIQLRNNAKKRRGTPGPVAAGRVALRQGRADQVLALQSPARHAAQRSRAAREAALADRARLPRAEGRARARSLRGPNLPRLEPSRYPRLDRPRVPHPGANPAPASQGGSLTLFGIVRELQALLACWQGTRPICRRELPPDHHLRAPPT